MLVAIGTARWRSSGSRRPFSRSRCTQRDERAAATRAAGGASRERRAASVAVSDGASRPPGQREGGAPQARRAGRLLDQRGDAAGPGAAQSPPREIAEQVGAALSDVLGSDLVRFEVAGPGFVNLFLSDAWYRRALRTVLDAGERFGAGGAAGGAPGPGGVRLGQPDRPAGRRQRAPRRLRRRPVAGAAAPRPRGVARVLLQRRRLADPPAGGVGAGAGSRREVPEGGYQGEYVRDLAAQIPGVEAMDAGRGGGGGGGASAGADQGDARALRRSLRPVLLRAHAA